MGLRPLPFIMKNFKPNLIPNAPKDGSFGEQELRALIEKNGGASQYIINRKKDGVRMVLGVGDYVLSRSLKAPGSDRVVERFQELNDACRDAGIVLEGEFYMHGPKFNVINSFFANTDVARYEYKKKIEKLKEKNPKKFKEDFGGYGIEFLTTFHQNLCCWIFDGYVKGSEHKGYRDRMLEIFKVLETKVPVSAMMHIVLPCWREFDSFEQIQSFYDKAIEDGWEGLVLTHMDHSYKYGRSSIKQGTLLKMKDDKKEWDGVVLDVIEGTQIKEGVERTTNELGRSVTSKKKDDREPSGKAKGFLIEFEDKGQFIVNLRGFDDDDKKELLENKEQYIGRHFRYNGMSPIKDFPRHAYFDCWRDEK